MCTSITGLFVVAKSLNLYFFGFKHTILSLTFKERVLYPYLQACLLWHHLWIDILFRFEPAILSLMLKERGINVYLACLFWQYPSNDNLFRFKRVILSLILKEQCIHL